MVTCRNHPDREAPQSCAGCSTPFCDACLVRFEKLLFCESCKARFLAGVDEGPRPARNSGPASVARRDRRPETGRGAPVQWLLGCMALVFAGVFGIVIIATIAEPWNALRKDRRVATAIDRMVEIGAALERYRIDKGQYPERLEQLVPTYLTDVPEDPYSGQGMRYDGHARLWSLGPDRKDDGGEAPDDLVYDVVADG